MDMFIIKSICKGGGYRYCRTEPPHPKRNVKNLYPLHRVILENRLGRLLTYNEIAHHKNGDKKDDSPENIELMTRGEHTIHHNYMAAPVQAECAGCRGTIVMTPWQLKQKLRWSKDGRFYCSVGCRSKL